MSEIRDQILGALEKLGPSSVTTIADKVGIEPSNASYHLRAMLTDKAVKAQGKTHGRRFALPSQKFEDGDDAPASTRRGGKKRKKGAKKNGHQPRAAFKLPPDFIPALSSDHRLVLVRGGKLDTFNKAETSAIADIILANFEPG